MAMMGDASDKLGERDEIEALLPWYVSGRLDVQSRARVERYLKAHPEMREHLAFAQEEADAAVAANEAIPAPGPEALQRLRTSIAATRPQQSVFTRFSERLADWVGGLTPPQLGLAAALAALLIVAQAAAISGLVMERVAGPTYETAGGGEETGQGIELLVIFSETASMGEISNLLKRIGAIIVDGPKAGLYRVRLPETGEEGRQAAIEALQKSGAVKSVLSGQ
jgi:hypothetical protein